MLKLINVMNSHPVLRMNMKRHYSKPLGFVGRNLCYIVMYETRVYGSIVGGSSTLHLPGRDEFFCINKQNKKENLLRIVNNTFFHIEPIGGEYPIYNFSTKIIKEFRRQISKDWYIKYGNTVIGFETLVEPPRTGELYIRDKWKFVGTTRGETCKRQSGQGSDGWGGVRVWNKTDLRPKYVFCKINEEIPVKEEENEDCNLFRFTTP